MLLLNNDFFKSPEDTKLLSKSWASLHRFYLRKQIKDLCGIFIWAYFLDHYFGKIGFAFFAVFGKNNLHQALFWKINTIFTLSPEIGP